MKKANQSAPVMENYRLLFNNISYGIQINRLVFDEQGQPVDYEILDINPAYEERSGLSREQVIGKMAADALPAIDPAWMHIYGEVVKTGKPMKFEVFRDTINCWFNVQVDSLGTDNLFSIIIKEITDRMQTEEALRESEIRYRTIFETAGEGIVYAAPDGTFLHCNQRFADMMGCSIEEIQGKNSADFRLTGKSPQVMNLHGSLSKVGIMRGEFKFCRRDGSEVWSIFNISPVINEEGEHIASFSLHTEITERKRAEEALRESERNYRELVKFAAAGIYEVDFRTQRILSVNDAMLQITGYSREEMLRLNPFDLLDSQSKVKFQERLSHWLNGNEPDQSVDYKVITKYGREIYALLNVTFTRDENGSPKGALVIAHDITERILAEEALRKSEKRALNLVEKLRQADQNKNSFINMLSHELRNPLASIMMSLDLMEQFPAGGKQASAALEIARRQGKQLARLVDDLLDFTRITRNKVSLKTEKTELNELVKKAAEVKRPKFTDKNVTLEVNMAAPIYIEADSARLTQVFDNLLDNAAKFTSGGDHVTIAVSRDTGSGEAAVTVEDTGRGIDPNLLEHLFEPFMQADKSLDRSLGGLGLGLAIVKGMVELHGGRVEAFSEGLGKGAGFTVRLPLLLEQNQNPESFENPDNRSQTLLNVLMIEDNKDLTDIMCELLDFLGHLASASHTAADGIRKAKEIKPDVILCDIGLPDMSGHEAAKLIRKDAGLKGVYLIAMSGYTQPEDKKRSREAGFDRHLGKPIDLDTLKKVLDEVAGKKDLTG